VGPRAGPDAVVYRKIPSLSGLEPPIIQVVAQRYTTDQIILDKFGILQ
jgi:hypothetical protein